MIPIPIWWRGHGRFTPLIIFAGGLLGLFVSTMLRRQGLPLGLVAAAVANYLVAIRLPGSSLYSIPMPFWSVILLATAVYLYTMGPHFF